jgi:hypothetical protein
MKKLLSFFLVIAFSTPVLAQEISKEISFSHDFDSTEGIKMFERSQFKNDFYQLVNFYQPQKNPIYCGIASSVIVLNALNYGEIASQKDLEITRPEEVGGGVLEYTIYSQNTFLNEKTDKIKNRAIIDFKEKAKLKNGEVYDAGLSLADLAKILSGPYKMKVKTIYADKNDAESLEEFRSVVKRIFAEKKSFIIANFDGKILNKKSSGHFSPIAAYDEESDSVLVLDVALHKNKWYFVKIEKLLEAMNTKDGETYRGYVLVKRSFF